MRALLLTLVVVWLVACRATASDVPAASPTLAQPAAPTQPASPTEAAAPAPTAAPPAPTRMPIINVDDMMGFFPPQTVYVAMPDHVSAITLLNHFTRYQIQTGSIAQVSSDATGQWLYLLDTETSGTSRLRGFDIPFGAQRAVQATIADVAADRRALSTLSDGRVLVLKSDANHAWVDAYAAVTLRPLGAVMDKPGCGDRLLASGRRIAIVCLATGEIAVDDLHGNHAAIDGALPALVATAMAEDGTLYVATTDQQLAVVPAGASTLAGVMWPSEWRGSILPEGLAIAQGGDSAVIAQRSDDGAWLRVLRMSNPAERKSLRLAGVPHGGILTLWPFAYYAVESTIRHIDLTSGLLETMAEVGAGAVPGAVVNG